MVSFYRYTILMTDKNRYFEYILQQFNILYVFKHTKCFFSSPFSNNNYAKVYKNRPVLLGTDLPHIGLKISVRNALLAYV